MSRRYIFFKHLIFYNVCLILLYSCATQKVELAQTPISFDRAVRTLVHHLFHEIKNDQNVFEKLGETRVVLDPIVDASSGEVVKVSR
jgi:hypothetical protein